MTAFEGSTSDDAALFSGPGLSVGVWGTGINNLFCVWAGGWNLPAIAKCQCICHCLKGACSKIIFTAAVIVSTQSTDLFLRQTNPNPVGFFHIWGTLVFTLCRKISLGVGIYMILWVELNENTGFLVPHEQDSTLDGHHQVKAKSANWCS